MTDILVQTSGGRCDITLNRPDKKNALIPEMYQTMAEAIEAAAEDESVRVVVIRAAGNDFTAGNDISTFADNSSDNMAVTVRFMRALMACPVPVVAQVKGNAVGIGTTLLLHCDFVVAANSSKFIMPFINLGLVPEYASSYLLPKISGHMNAAKWLMLGAPFTADEALAGNLISQVEDADQLDTAVDAICKQLLGKPRNAMVQTKALLKHDTQQVSEHIEKELVHFAAALQSEPAKEAFDAFLNKRPIDKTRFLG